MFIGSERGRTASSTSSDTASHQPVVASPGWSSISSASDAHSSSGTALSHPDIRADHPDIKTNTPTSLSPSYPPRSTSLLPVMGQAFSKSHATPFTPPPPPSSPSTAAKGLTAAMAGGIKLKRALAGRRKKSEDVTRMDRSKSRDEILQQDSIHRQQRIEVTASSSSSPAQLTHSASASPEAGHPRGAKHLTQLATQVFNVGAKRSAKLSLQQHNSPVPPPKPDAGQSAQLRPLPPRPSANYRESIIPISPGISSAVDYMRMGEEERENRQEQDQGIVEKQEVVVVSDVKEKEVEPDTEKTEGEKADGTEKGEMKDSWRKSDSTISHHTIRPGAGGSRSSRPVSMAESLQSNHTIVPVNKRLSALVTDADFGMPEEDDSDKSMQENNNIPTPFPHNDIQTNVPSVTIVQQASPASSLKTKNRRSMSLNITSHSVFSKPKLPLTPSSATDLKYPQLGSPRVPQGVSPPPSKEALSSTQTPTLIVPSIIGKQPTAASGRNEPVNWSASTASKSTPTPSHRPNMSNPYTTFPPPPSTPSYTERNLPPLPPQPQPQPATPSGHSFRQTAISMTSGFAPAAGLAKRAVEKMGRAWGISSSSSVSTGHNSGYSSSSSGHTPPSSYSGSGVSHHLNQRTHPDSKHHHHTYSTPNNELARTSSNQSAASGTPQHQPQRLKKARLYHTHKAPSVSSTASTATSSASLSDQDAFMNVPEGPVLGKRLRGPLRTKSGGRMVFGQDLKTVVRETSVGVGQPHGWSGRRRNWGGEAGDGGEKGEADGVGALDVDKESEEAKTRHGSVRKGQLKALEERKLPALVVRCAQHLLIWGVQEEGLFRVSGRPSHVSKLRAEFDSGADFDMTECSPGDLDPHAVASVFKAFLRELPEPLLTHALLPYFDAAIAQEHTTNTENEYSSRARSNSRGPGLPSGPKNSSNLPSIRKPPSLSTLAMPSFAGMRPPSKPLLNVFRSLLAQLPEENRDLIRTVTELIKATARESKDTKMPLSNLLLVFCPSLNMNPPLLKVLCEGEGLWNPVRDTKPEMIDTRAPLPPSQGGEVYEDARDGREDDGESESLQSESPSRRSEDTPGSAEYHASTEDIVGAQTTSQRKPISTVYLDMDSVSMDDSSLLSLPPSRDPHLRSASIAELSLRDDRSSYMSTSEDQENTFPHDSDVHSQSLSPPLLTSSAESLNTPATTSSGHPSFSHLPVTTKDDSLGKYDLQHGMLSPIIAEPSPMQLSPATPRRPAISNPIPITGPIQFPSSASDVERSPSSPTKIENRRSIPVLSLPSFSPTSFLGNDFSATQPLSPRGNRIKKPSLHLLFSKKSISSLSSPKAASSPSSLRPVISSPYLRAPHSASDSSVSTPMSAVTAPQSSTFTLPPKLDTPIESSPLSTGMGLGIYEIPATPEKNTSQAPRLLPVPPSVLAPATSLVPGQTPIADRYQRSPSPSPSLSTPKSPLPLASPPEPRTTPNHLSPNSTMRPRGTSTSSRASSTHLDTLDEQGSEDWTQSVLIAADVDDRWTAQQTLER